MRNLEPVNLVVKNSVLVIGGGTGAGGGGMGPQLSAYSGLAALGPQLPTGVIRK